MSWVFVAVGWLVGGAINLRLRDEWLLSFRKERGVEGRRERKRERGKESEREWRGREEREKKRERDETFCFTRRP
jgi:hypothetical protein